MYLYFVIAFWPIYVSLLIWLSRQIRRRISPANLRSSRGDWAIVTGSTDGIGLEFARALASRGYNLLLISRNETKLSQVEQNLRQNYPTVDEIRSIVHDFGSTDYSLINIEIKKIIDKPEYRLAVLVNNVGMSADHPDYFTAIDYEFYEKLLNVNITSYVSMCHQVLPTMEKQKFGYIINVSSFAAANPTPLLAVYSGSKAFIDNFSMALMAEYESKNIVIQSLLPSFVVSNMSRIYRSSLWVPSARDYVTEAMKTIGIESRSSGYWFHDLMFCFTQDIMRLFFGIKLPIRLSYNKVMKMRNRYYAKLSAQVN